MCVENRCSVASNEYYIEIWLKVWFCLWVSTVMELRQYVVEKGVRDPYQTCLQVLIFLYNVSMISVQGVADPDCLGSRFMSVVLWQFDIVFAFGWAFTHYWVHYGNSELHDNSCHFGKSCTQLLANKWLLLVVYGCLLLYASSCFYQ